MFEINNKCATKLVFQINENKLPQIRPNTVESNKRMYNSFHSRPCTVHSCYKEENKKIKYLDMKLPQIPNESKFRPLTSLEKLKIIMKNNRINRNASINM